MAKQASKADRKAALNALIYSDAEDGHIEWGDAMLTRQGLEREADRELPISTRSPQEPSGDLSKGPATTGAPSLPTLPRLSGPRKKG
jgi:hypothetical protein